MEVIQFKFKASQGRSIYYDRSLKIKVLKCNADIFFNNQCLIKKIVPNDAKIKVPATSPAARKTQDKAQFTRIKERYSLIINQF